MVRCQLNAIDHVQLIEAPRSKFTPDMQILLYLLAALPSIMTLACASIAIVG
jgi:hypothetical protein